MKSMLATFIIVFITFIGSLAALASRPQAPEALLILAVLAQILVNSALHLALVSRRKLHFAVLPAAWALCIVPLYIYSYHIESNPGFLGRNFLFVILGLFMLLPVFAVSLLTSIVSRRRKRAAAKRAERQ